MNLDKKLELAQETLLKLLDKAVIPKDFKDSIGLAWAMTDEMEAEYNKRKQKEIENGVEQDEELLKGCDSTKLEWQPGWGQAPNRMNYFFMNRDGGKYYTVNKPSYISASEHVMDCINCGGDCYSDASKQIFQGDWKDSLRKRP